MASKVSKNGARLTVTEYEVRHIDIDGDATDVENFDTVAEANKRAFDIVDKGEAVASVVEKHVSVYPAHLADEPSVYTEVAIFGDQSAIAAWRGT
jgi:hypothetical protein